MDTFDNQAVDRLSVVRFSVPKHENNIVLQVFAFITFAIKVCWGEKCQRYDLVVGTSSRLMTAFLALIVARASRAKLLLDIRDLFVDSLSSVFPEFGSKWLLAPLNWFEKIVYCSADHLNFISGGFESYASKFPLKTTPTFYTHGIDDIFLQANFAKRRDINSLRVVYAGNIGKGQNLSQILVEFCENGPSVAEFFIFGGGSDLTVLRQRLIDRNISCIFLKPPVPRARLLKVFKDADILFLHLSDCEAFKKVIPSKLFEYLATGKPILAGVSGYPAEFAKSFEGVVVFQPGNAVAMSNALDELLRLPSHFDRSESLCMYERSQIMDKMTKEASLNQKLMDQPTS